MTINIEKLAVECGVPSHKALPCSTDRYNFTLDQLQAFAEAVASDVKAENEALKVLLSEARDDVCACLNFELSDRPDKDIVAYYEKQLKSIDEFLKASEPPPSIQLEEFTLPPVNLPVIGRAK